MEASKRKKSVTLSKQERGEILAAYRESGMTQKRFAESWGLNVGTLRNWLYSAGSAPGSGDAFVEVSLGNQAGAVATIRFPGGTSLEMPLEAFERSATALVRELARPC